MKKLKFSLLRRLLVFCAICVMLAEARAEPARPGPASRQEVARTVDDLAEFGCRSMIALLPKLRLKSKIQQHGELYRVYESNGLAVTTRSVENEIIHSAKADIDALKRMRVLPDISTFASFAEIFGRPYKSKDDEFDYLPESEKFGSVTVIVKLAGQRLSYLEWTCG